MMRSKKNNEMLQWLWDTNIPPPDLDSVYLACKHSKGKIIYKIGWSADPEDRIKQLGKGVQLVWAKQFSDAGTIERALHEHFANKHLYGEWFDLNESDIEYIKGLTL